MSDAAAGTALRTFSLSPGARRAAGAWLLVLTALSFWKKSSEGVLGEELWLCNVSTVVQGVGMLLAVELLATTGFVAMAAMGFIGWALDTIATGTTGISVAIHLSSMTIGLLEARRKPVPPGAFVGAWLLWVVLQPLSWLFTDPALNVNVVHSPWPPFVALVPSMWAYRVFNALLAIAFLAGARFFLRFTVERKSP